MYTSNETTFLSYFINKLTPILGPINSQVIDAKFSDPKLATLLLQTGDAELLEGNTWNDRIWGVDSVTLQGQNYLGKILTDKREQLRN